MPQRARRLRATKSTKSTKQREHKENLTRPPAGAPWHTAFGPQPPQGSSVIASEGSAGPPSSGAIAPWLTGTAGSFKAGSSQARPGFPPRCRPLPRSPWGFKHHVRRRIHAVGRTQRERQDGTGRSGQSDHRRLCPRCQLSTTPHGRPHAQARTQDVVRFARDRPGACPGSDRHRHTRIQPAHTHSWTHEAGEQRR